MSMDFTKHKPIIYLFFILLAILMLYFILDLAVFNPDSTRIPQDLNDLNRLNHERPISFFLISPIMGFLGAIIGAIIVYFLMSRITQTQQVQKKNTKIILNFLTEHEKKVIELLLNNNGHAFQYELNRIEGLSRVKTYRILQNLEDKKIITKENFLWI